LGLPAAQPAEGVHPGHARTSPDYGRPLTGRRPARCWPISLRAGRPDDRGQGPGGRVGCRGHRAHQAGPKGILARRPTAILTIDVAHAPDSPPAPAPYIAMLCTRYRPGPADIDGLEARRAAVRGRAAGRRGGQGPGLVPGTPRPTGGPGWRRGRLVTFLGAVGGRTRPRRVGAAKAVEASPADRVAPSGGVGSTRRTSSTGPEIRSVVICPEGAARDRAMGDHVRGWSSSGPTPPSIRRGAGRGGPVSLRLAAGRAEGAEPGPGRLPLAGSGLSLARRPARAATTPQRAGQQAKERATTTAIPPPPGASRP